jgi:hypothetical protein
MKKTLWRFVELRFEALTFSSTGGENALACFVELRF